jgi:tight adherence protein B
MMNWIISTSVLVIIAILAYLVIKQASGITLKRRRKTLSTYLQEEREDEKSNIASMLERQKIKELINPAYIISEAEKNGVILTRQSLFSTFFIGIVIGVLVFIVYFKAVIYLIPLSVIGGIIAVNIRLKNIKKEYLQQLDSKLSIYMSSLATSLKTFNNINDAVRSIIPTLEDPVKSDVEKALINLQNGLGVEDAFYHISQKYGHKYVKLFHDQLNVIVNSGTNDTSSIRTVAFKMKKRETYKRNLQTKFNQGFKTWKTFVVMCMSAPLLFLFASTENFTIAMSSIAMSIVYVLTFTLIYVTYKKLKELEMYDVTENIELKD